MKFIDSNITTKSDPEKHGPRRTKCSPLLPRSPCDASQSRGQKDEMGWADKENDDDHSIIWC